MLAHLKIYLIPIFLIITPVIGQEHFIPVDTTGLPYIIVITGMTLNEAPVGIGSEIGIFDDTLCVGSAVFNGNYNFQITAWQGSSSMQLPGFTAGNLISYKIWTQISGDYREIDMSPIYEKGDGAFGYGSYSIVALTANFQTSNDIEYPQRYNCISAFPNPFNNALRIMVDIPDRTQFNLKIYSLTGNVVFQKAGVFNESEKQYFTWNAKTNGGMNLSSGIYLIDVKNDFTRFISKVTYQK